MSLAGGAIGRASVPSGASTGHNEAHELRDGIAGEYFGRGVKFAVANIDGEIAPDSPVILDEAGAVVRIPRGIGIDVVCAARGQSHHEFGEILAEQDGGSAAGGAHPTVGAEREVARRVAGRKGGEAILAMSRAKRRIQGHRRRLPQAAFNIGAQPCAASCLPSFPPSAWFRPPSAVQGLIGP